MKRLPALVLLLFALTACQAPTSRAAPATAGTPFVDPTLGPRATSRPSGPSTTLRPGQGDPARLDCGSFTLDQGDDLPAEAARCFVDAASAGRPVRLSVTAPTVEGAPIPTTYTAGADGRTEVVSDFRKDPFSSQAVVKQICQGPSAGGQGIRFARCAEPARVRK